MKKIMRKDAFAVLAGLLMVLGAMAFCGCLSTKVEEKDYEDIVFKSKSNIVQLGECSLDLEKNKFGHITTATVNGEIENTVSRMINVYITCKFYDKNDEFIEEKPYKIFGLRGKPENGYSRTFTIIYDDVNASRVDHVRLEAVEQLI